MPLGAFLAQWPNSREDSSPTNTSEQLYPLRDLLAAVGRPLAQSPSTFAYDVGLILAGVVLQVAATTVPTNSTSTDVGVFTELVQGMSSAPDRFDAMSMGIRHGLCRQGIHGQPYVLSYWRAHKNWSMNDEHCVDRVADANNELIDTWLTTMQIQQSLQSADAKATQLLRDLGNDITEYLEPRVASLAHASERTEFVNMAQHLAQAIQRASMTYISSSQP